MFARSQGIQSGGNGLRIVPFVQFGARCRDNRGRRQEIPYQWLQADADCLIAEVGFCGVGIRGFAGLLALVSWHVEERDDGMDSPSQFGELFLGETMLAGMSEADTGFRMEVGIRMSADEIQMLGVHFF